MFYCNCFVCYDTQDLSNNSDVSWTLHIWYISATCLDSLHNFTTLGMGLYTWTAKCTSRYLIFSCFTCPSSPSTVDIQTCTWYGTKSTKESQGCKPFRELGSFFIQESIDLSERAPLRLPHVVLTLPKGETNWPTQDLQPQSVCRLTFFNTLSSECHMWKVQPIYIYLLSGNQTWFAGKSMEVLHPNPWVSPTDSTRKFGFGDIVVFVWW